MLTDPHTMLDLYAARADELHADAARSRRARLAARHAAAARDDGGRTAGRWWSRHRPAAR
jgi:hypothetical protein